MEDISIVSKNPKIKSEPKVKKNRLTSEVLDAEIISKSKSKKGNGSKSILDLVDNNDLRNKTKFAVVNINGQQEIIFEGQELEINHIGEEKPEISEVLLYVDGDIVKVGTPNISGIKIDIENAGKVRGKKIHVREFHAKSRYRRSRGSRPTYSKLSVKSIKG